MNEYYMGAWDEDPYQCSKWASPLKWYPAGMLFAFVHAPPRWRGEDPRAPGDLLGQTGIVIDGPHQDDHGWGGLFNVLVNGQVFQYYGDFMSRVVY